MAETIWGHLRLHHTTQTAPKYNTTGTAIFKEWPTVYNCFTSFETIATVGCAR